MATTVTTGSLHSRETDIRPIAVSSRRIDHSRRLSTEKEPIATCMIGNLIETDAALTLAEEHRLNWLIKRQKRTPGIDDVPTRAHEIII